MNLAASLVMSFSYVFIILDSSSRIASPFDIYAFMYINSVSLNKQYSSGVDKIFIINLSLLFDVVGPRT